VSCTVEDAIHPGRTGCGDWYYQNRICDPIQKPSVGRNGFNGFGFPVFEVQPNGRDMVNGDSETWLHQFSVIRHSLAEEKRQETGNVRLNRHLVRFTRGSRMDAGQCWPPQWPHWGVSLHDHARWPNPWHRKHRFFLISDITWLKKRDKKLGTFASIGIWFDSLEAAEWMLDNFLAHVGRHSGHIGVSLYTTTLDGRILGIGSIVS
jgi:hypothetical protein